MTPPASRPAATSPPGAGTGGGTLRDQRRREKDRVSRNHILDAAERVFGSKGFHGATLKEVAEQAEFSVGGLYAFFEGKDDLFAQVLDRQSGALLDHLRDAVAGVASPVEQLHRVVDASVDYFAERPDFYRLFQRELGGTTWSMRASLNEAAYEQYRAVMAFEEAIFAAGVAVGEIRDEDPVIQAALFSGLLQAYLAQWVFGLDDAGRSAVEEAFPRRRLHELVDRAFAA